MNLYGLIGFPLEHSFSPAYFTEKFKKEGIDAEYRLFPLDSLSEFPQLLNRYPNLRGLNVTIPYKMKIRPFLSEIRGAAHSIGAINTIVFARKDNQRYTIGFNTDAYGFEKALVPLLKDYHHKALILGTGGSSQTAAFVLRKLGIQWMWVSRTHSGKSTQTINYSDITGYMLKEYRLIINTTPLGMYPKVEGKPDLPYDAIDQHHLLFDLIYNPALTAFLKEGKKRGAITKNGYQMLCLQAERSWELWNHHAE